jgi:hypothetical protein
MKVVRPAGGRVLLATQSPDNARIDLIKKSSGRNLTRYIRELQLFKEKSKREREEKEENGIETSKRRRWEGRLDSERAK